MGSVVALGDLKSEDAGRADGFNPLQSPGADREWTGPQPHRQRVPIVGRNDPEGGDPGAPSLAWGGEAAVDEAEVSGMVRVELHCARAMAGVWIAPNANVEPVVAVEQGHAGIAAESAAAWSAEFEPQSGKFGAGGPLASERNHA
ncbi:MAG TPA: hypothetical protein VIJ33_05040 [Solirubrobacteraceae bacterium]